jgi:hypothetical protein
MLDSVRLLLDMGYKLYGSMGTSDYYNEHGLFVETIDWMYGNNENSQVKSSLSLSGCHTLLEYRDNKSVNSFIPSYKLS